MPRALPLLLLAACDPDKGAGAAADSGAADALPLEDCDSPGAPEICDEIDNDCDGEVDEGVQATFYADSDGDGHGDPAVAAAGCAPPDGYVADATDCDDADPYFVADCFATFDGTTGAAWETLAAPTEPPFSLMSYHPAGWGYLYNTYGSTGQRYDPAADAWSDLGSAAPYGEAWSSMAPWGGDLWLIRNSAIYRYDPEEDAWATVGAISGGDDSNMTESDERGVIYGHTDDGHIVAYDAVSGEVTYHETGEGGQFETRLAYDPLGRALFFGAFFNAALYRFDLETRAITEAAPIPEGSLGTVVCSDRSGHVYASGGASGATMYQYDAAADAWSRIPDLPSDHGNNGSCAVSGDGWLYVGVPESMSFYRLKLY